tara:strand:+ start:1843 stop:2670 length:828 start_codon:yes stop_codon:yes gene_type:complete
MISILKPLIKQFMPFAKEKMGFSRPPRLFLRQDQQNADDPMGKTGFYDPQAESITLYITGRHPKDIMRSLAHELQHHTQKCNGDFESVQNMGEEGYAQTNPHMRSMEIQAYQASIVFRDWEDSCKGTIYYEHLQKGDKSSMSTKKWKNRELNGLLMERFGFDFKPLVENLEEMCPGAPEGPEAEVTVIDGGGGDMQPEEAGPEERAVELMDELKNLIMQLTGGGEEMEEEPMEEGRSADRPKNKHRNKPGRGRRMDEVTLYKMIKKTLEEMIKGN